MSERKTCKLCKGRKRRPFTDNRPVNSGYAGKISYRKCSRCKGEGVEPEGKK
jgi:hypothetical protein